MVMVKIRKQPPPFSGSSRKIIVYASLCLALVTAGCDSPASTAPTLRGEARTEKLKTSFTPEEARTLAQPLSETPGLSVEKTAAQNEAVGGEAYETQLSPALGLQTKRLFATRVESDDERFERLEAAVQLMRDDFDKVSPSINRLMAIEQEIQTLVDQLQVLTGEAPVADAPIPPVSAELLEDPAVPTTMPPLPPDALAVQAAQAPSAPQIPAPPSAPVPAPPAAAPSQSAVPAGAAVVALRVGDHDATTRIVFETTGQVSYTADIDPEKILLVNFASGTSQLAAAALAPKSTLVKSVDVTPQSGGGFIVAMTLSKMTRIVRQGVLPPDAENPHYRIYLDIER